jgi:tRNA A-37 threonylcarbamoyl transferase component Bud32
MPAPTTTLGLLDFVRKSGLLEPARLQEYVRGVPNADTLPPADLAKKMVADGLITPFQARHLLKGRYKNFFIGKFKVLEPLGSGGMSQVYLCEHSVMKHRVAMKLLPAQGHNDKVAVNRFLREARAAAAVNHPNVVRAHDFDLAEGKFYYLIMEFVDGINLHDLVKKIGPLAPEVAANYVAQATTGLAHISECGLIHRDLKPGNLLVDRSGLVRILDLGLARFTNDDQDNLTRQNQGKSILGTADFLAPEQAIQADKIDVRADIYSLGATLYFLLSGRAPFEQQSVTHKLLAHQLRDPDPLTGVPAELAAVVVKMMKKAPADRYQSPAEVIAALAPWASVPIAAPDPIWFPGRAGGSSPGTGGVAVKTPVLLPPVAPPLTPMPTAAPKPAPVVPVKRSFFPQAAATPAAAPPAAPVPVYARVPVRSRRQSERNLWFILAVLVALIIFGVVVLLMTRKS